MPDNRRHGGFTLLEIMVALAVLGTALFVLLDGHMTTLKLHNLTVETVETRQMLEETAAKAELSVYAGILSETGDFGARYPDYTWSFEAVTQSDYETSSLFFVQASVMGPDGEQALQFYVYDVGLGQENADMVDMRLRQRVGGGEAGAPGAAAGDANTSSGARTGAGGGRQPVDRSQLRQPNFGGGRGGGR